MVKAKTPTKIITVDYIDVEFTSVKKDKYNNIVHYYICFVSLIELSSFFALLFLSPPLFFFSFKSTLFYTTNSLQNKMQT